MRPDVHLGGIPPAEERLVGLVLALDEVERTCRDLLIHGLHALLGQRAGILDLLRAIRIRPAVQHAPRPELLLEFGILRIVRILRFLLGVQVIEIAEEFVEAVHGRQELVAVAEVVLAELAADVALRFEQFGDGRIFGLQAEFRSGQADLGQAGANRRLAGDERGAAGGTALLAIPVGEHRAFFGDAVDVRGPIPHDAVVVGADVEPADVIAPDDQDVRLFRCSHKFPLTNRVTGMRSKPYADFGVGVFRPRSNGARRTFHNRKSHGQPSRAARVRFVSSIHRQPWPRLPPRLFWRPFRLSAHRG